MLLTSGKIYADELGRPAASQTASADLRADKPGVAFDAVFA